MAEEVEALCAPRYRSDSQASTTERERKPGLLTWIAAERKSYAPECATKPMAKSGWPPMKRHQSHGTCSNRLSLPCPRGLAFVARREPQASGIKKTSKAGGRSATGLKSMTPAGPRRQKPHEPACNLQSAIRSGCAFRRCVGFRLRDTPRPGIAGAGSPFRHVSESHGKISCYT